MGLTKDTEFLELGRKLSPRQRREWLNYGRYLRSQKSKPGAVPKNGDAAWEGLLADAKPRPKLAALAAKALAQHRAGNSTALSNSRIF
jgi:hypothetical protein